MSHVAGKHTGLLRDAHAFAADAQDHAGVDFTSGLHRASLRRTQCTSDLSALSSGVMTSVALYLNEGDVVSELTFMSGGTAAGTPTNQWFALYDEDGELLAQTADQEDAAWGSNTAVTLELSSMVTIGADGVYFAAAMVAATTAPTLVGVEVQHANVADGVMSGEAVLAQTSGSSLTATAPSSIASPTTVATVPLVVAT